jgi:acyl carrier protein
VLLWASAPTGPLVIGQAGDLGLLAPEGLGVEMVEEVGMSQVRKTDGMDLADTNLDAVRAVVAQLIVQIAPERDAGSIDFAASLQDVDDLDSLDLLRLVALTAEATGIVVPPRDYPSLARTSRGPARALVPD